MQENKGTIGVMSLVSICVAFTITLNNFTNGAQVTVAMSFGNAIITIIISWILLTIFWTLSGLMGAASHQNSVVIFKNVFGRKGAIIPSLMMCIAVEGFSIFDYFYMGLLMMNLFPGAGVAIFYVGVVIGALFAIFGAIKNVSSYKWLTNLTVPIALAIFIAMMITTISYAGGMQTIVNYMPPVEETMPIMAGVNIMVSSFIAVTSGFSDITCSAKSKKAVFIAMPLAMLAIAFQFFVAQVGAQGIGKQITDFTALAACMIGPMFYLSNIFGLFAQGNTVPGSTVVISTQISENFHVPFKAVVIAQPIIACIGSVALFLGADISAIVAFSSFLACVFGPLLAINFSEFYLVRHGKLEGDEKLPLFSVSGVVALACGFVVGLIFTYALGSNTFLGIPNVVCTALVGFIVHLILRKGLKLH